MDAQIKELESEIARLQIAITDKKRELANLRVQRSGVRVGDIVIGTGRHKDMAPSFRVERIDARWNPAWLIANPMRKNGTYGTKRVHLFDKWKLAS